MELICARCGKLYKRSPTRAEGSKYCSRRCQYGHVDVVCQRCGKTFAATPKRNRKFCSVQCKNGTLTKVCKACGRVFKSSPSQDASFCSIPCKHEGARNKAKHCAACGKKFHPRRRNILFCSRACAQRGRRRRIQKRCTRCGKTFTIHWARRQTAIYCSESCRLRSQKNTRWPDKDQLRHLVTYLSFAKIGRMFGVTPTAVQYWCRTYGIEAPVKKQRIKGVDHNRKLSGYIGEAYGI